MSQPPGPYPPPGMFPPPEPRRPGPMSGNPQWSVAGADVPSGPPQQPPTFPPPRTPVPAGRFNPPVLRRKRVWVIPILTILLGALVMCVVLLSVLRSHGHDPVVGVLAIALSAGSAVIGILLLSWLDRWEPEPPHLLLAAFFWGGAISLLVVLLVTPVITLFIGTSDFAQAVIGAPLVEESAKGSFLLIVILLTRRGRAEFNSLTDAIVYAGFVGVGFSFVEDMLYLATQQTATETIQLAGYRLGLGAYSHAIYCSMTAIGLWLAVNARNPLVRVLAGVGGWCLAVLLHGLHNGSTFFGSGAYFAEMFLIGFPAAIALLVIALISRHREGRILARQLPPMVHNGWLTPEEAGWIGTLRGRRQRRQAAKISVPDDRKQLKNIQHSATELAFVRERLDRQREPRDPALLARHAELVQLLVNNRAWASQRLAPYQGAWQPVAGLPGSPYLRG